MLGKLFLRKGQHDHRGPISQKYTLTSRKQSSVEAFYTVSTHNVSTPLPGSGSYLFCSGLGQVLEHLEWPNNPVAEHSRSSWCNKLSKLSVHYFSVSSPAVNLHEVASHNSDATRVHVHKAFIDFWELPTLSCLSSNLRVFEGTFQYRSEASW